MSSHADKKFGIFKSNQTLTQVNGSIGKVSLITDQVIYVQFFKHNTSILLEPTPIMRESFTAVNAAKKEVARRSQFPLILSYAMY